MKIQIISTIEENIKFLEIEGYSVISDFDQDSPDAFDINIIDVFEYVNFDFADDFIGEAMDNMFDMLLYSKETKILFVLPRYDAETVYRNETIYDSDSFRTSIHRIFRDTCDFKYENTKTTINNLTYQASHYNFHNLPHRSSYASSVVSSDIGNKTTMWPVAKNILFTTLQIFESAHHFETMLQYMLPDLKESKPDWIQDISILNDLDLNHTIEKEQDVISNANIEINKCKEELNINHRYKSILYTSGVELEDVVIDILSELFNYDRRKFSNDKKEDFRIVLEDVVYIVEIKGIGSNLKSENVSQIEVHCSGCIDDMEESGTIKTVKGLLIVNTERNKRPEDRTPINDTQIDLAKRYGILIITTVDLLKL
ncbi:MAG: hypothetical protein WC201_02870, partial [Bacilli bacterium]